MASREQIIKINAISVDGRCWRCNLGLRSILKHIFSLLIRDIGDNFKKKLPRGEINKQ